MLGVKTIGAQTLKVTRGLILTAFLSSVSSGAVITASYSPSESSRVEITGTASVIWTATFDFVSNLIPDLTTSPLISEEFATTVTSMQKGLAFIKEAKSELVTNILASGISN